MSGLLFKEYLRNGKVKLRRFLIRRGFKIYPAFYALLLFTVIVRIYSGHDIPVQSFLGELLFFQNYLGGLWNHTWSLAVEEHFYIGIAVICYLLLRAPQPISNKSNPFRIIPRIFVFVALACLLLRISNLFICESYSHQWFLTATHLRIDSLMFGVFISYHWHFNDLEIKLQKIRTFVLLACGILCLLPAFLFPVEQYYQLITVFGVISFYVGSGFLVVAAVRLRNSRSRLLAISGALGAASYSIYLWHMPVATLGWLRVKQTSAWSAVKNLEGFDVYLPYLFFYLVGSLVFGWIMNKMIEWPVLKLRDRLFPRVAKTSGSNPKDSLSAKRS